jgi:hypothetical protein
MLYKLKTLMDMLDLVNTASDKGKSHLEHPLAGDDAHTKTALSDLERLINDFVYNDLVLYHFETTINKGVANGYPELDGTGKVPIAQLPGGLPPAAHASNHTTGTDQISDAVGGISPVHGLESAADKLKLDGIAAGADVTSANNPKAHAGSHVTGGGDVIADVVAGGNSGLQSGADKTKLNGIESGADVTGAHDPKAHTTSHKHGGSDEIATAVAAANAIPKADGTGKLDAGWLPSVGGFTNNMVSLSTNDNTDSSNYIAIGDLTLAAATFFGVHTIKFSVCAFVTNGALTGTVVLYNVTDSATVATLTYTELIATRKDSAALVLDAAPKLYEVRFKVTGGGNMLDRINCMWSGFEITT